jgi:hypothetical protein
MKVKIGAVCTVLAALAVAAPLAQASRAPSAREKAAIKRVALKKCNRNAPEPCRFHRARVSTVNARYAWADVTTEGFSAVLLKRPGAHSRRFRVVAVQGGGVETCRHWRAHAPRAVLRDLHVKGLTNEDTGAFGSCG